jgi:GMP synthase (glutamine-hydrolysing)
MGFAPLELTEAGARSPLRHLHHQPVLHWHGDTFDLPPGGEHLASTAVCRNQAFSIGAHALALQFHPEAELPALEDWFVGHAVELAAAHIDVPSLRAQAAKNLPTLREASGLMLKAWLDGLPS